MIRIVEKIIDISGRIAEYACLILVVFVAVDVFIRYVFNFSTPLSFELEWHLYSVMILLAMGYTLKYHKHVRVDIFYEMFSPKVQRWINILGCLLFLLPLAIVGLIYALPYAIYSFQINEGTPDPGGLPIWWVIKFFIPLGFLLLLLQALVWLYKLIVTK